MHWVRWTCAEIKRNILNLITRTDWFNGRPYSFLRMIYKPCHSILWRKSNRFAHDHGEAWGENKFHVWVRFGENFGLTQMGRVCAHSHSERRTKKRWEQFSRPAKGPAPNIVTATNQSYRGKTAGPWYAYQSRLVQRYLTTCSFETKIAMDPKNPENSHYFRVWMETYWNYLPLNLGRWRQRPFSKQGRKQVP